MLDVGAHIGTQSIPFVTRFGAGRVVAIEADPTNAALLRYTVLENALGDRVTVLNMAAGVVDGAVELQRSPINPGDHRVSPAESFQSGRETLRVPATRLDTLVKEGVFSTEEVALIWIDVQGHEGQFLAGAQPLLAAEAPVICEYWPFELRQAGGLALFHELVAGLVSRAPAIGECTSQLRARISRWPTTVSMTRAPITDITAPGRMNRWVGLWTRRKRRWRQPSRKLVTSDSPRAGDIRSETGGSPVFLGSPDDHLGGELHPVVRRSSVGNAVRRNPCMPQCASRIPVRKTRLRMPLSTGLPTCALARGGGLTCRSSGGPEAQRPRRAPT